MVIIVFWNVLMCYQIFALQRTKLSMIISNKNGKLPH